jgi:hypothetical protein
MRRAVVDSGRQAARVVIHQPKVKNHTATRGVTMKRLAYVPIVALLLSLSYVTLSAAPPDRPAGVKAENWVAVNDRLGVVLVESSGPMVAPQAIPMVGPDGQLVERGPMVSAGPSLAAPAGQVLLLKPPVGGYFMVKGAGGWTRLVVFEPLKGPGDIG